MSWGIYMKKEKTEYKKYIITRRKYNASQIAKAVGLGISLAAFGASMKGAFNNLDLNDIESFARQAGNKALNFYKELTLKCNPTGNVPAYVFLGLAGGFIVLMVHGRIKKRKFETKTIQNLSNDIKGFEAERDPLSYK